MKRVKVDRRFQITGNDLRSQNKLGKHEKQSSSIREARSVNSNIE